MAVSLVTSKVLLLPRWRPELSELLARAYCDLPGRLGSSSVHDGDLWDVPILPMLLGGLSGTSGLRLRPYGGLFRVAEPPLSSPLGPEVFKTPLKFILRTFLEV
ncbi:hypothetical protein KIN20_033630 [Parelaphostrongylus tenuis]|uniref:Uncharacterized protein n=1 Tax=Parelaphostrongylus tenuis TaxID=148309 RepID=A0AAD5WJ09_PARTN|nr:hypothetical protein KIN20_033630 [Parelaphostrongylus tenuis]